VFPQDDCVLLPIANTTNEALAEYVGEHLSAAIQSLCRVSPSRVQIEIGEGTGCAAICDMRR
jgi:6-pyruvoyltetrahydropterin/6-carboxytetrahydropterin synthase